MVRQGAWFLNFDAEDELARPAGYTPSAAMLGRNEALAERIRPSLLAPGDVLVPEGAGPVAGPDFIGRAWCPTPRALKALRRAGAIPAPAPPLGVLRAVNHRYFNAVLGQTLPGALYVSSPAEVLAAVSGPSPLGVWLLKRPFGFAGRGRLKVDPGRPGDLSHARPWIEASLRAGEGLAVEPLMERLGDFALHGHLAQGGEVILGEPTLQVCDESGAWRGSARAEGGELEAAERAALALAAREAAAALREAGYFGPFNVDAYRYRGEGGEPRFNARSEINARYSMGWAVGMGDRRPDLE